MHQPDCFDLARRDDSLDAKPDPLPAINRLIPWDSFRDRLRAALEQAGQRKTAAARMSGWKKCRFSRSWCRNGSTTWPTTRWNTRTATASRSCASLGVIWRIACPMPRPVGAVETLFADIDRYLKDKGYLAMGGQIINATIMPVPANRDIQAEN